MSPQIQTVISRDERRPRPSAWRHLLAVILKTIVPMVLLVVGGYTALVILDSGPSADRASRPRVPRLVEVVEIRTETAGPVLTAWGEAVPGRRLLLRSEVAGRVSALHPNLTPGGYIAEGEEILRIDDRDLRLALRRAEADALEIQARIAIERGQQAIGRRELSRLSRNLTAEQRSLVLREPQMAQLEAELAAAEAAIEQARLAVERASYPAPFNAVVLSEEVSVGSMLTQGTLAAELVSVDRFSLTLAIPAASLEWIDLDGGQSVRLTQRAVWGEKEFRSGRIERLNSRLTETGRMAEIIVAIDDPMILKTQNEDAPPVLLGAFLKAEIEGRAIENAVLLDRALLRANDTVWIMSEENTLEVRSVDVVWRGAEQVLISAGLRTGDRLVTTPLATHADGMKLRLREEGVSG